jgi:hypothetical protein
MIRGYPSYAIDGFTRPGRAALSILLDSSPTLRGLLRSLPTKRARIDAISNLLFDVEGGVCLTEPNDSLGVELSALSKGCWSGLRGAELKHGLAEMKLLLPVLNGIRSEVMSQIP